MHSILVPVEGSDDSRSAVELSIHWAAQKSWQLIGLGITDVPDLAAAEPIPVGAAEFKRHRDEQVVGQERRTIQNALSHFSVRCAEANVVSRIVERDGQPVEQIARESQRADMVILGRQLSFGLGDGTPGIEITADVVRHSPRPVVVVPHDLPTSETVVIGYDGSPESARALQLFQLSELGKGREICIVSVGTDPAQAAERAHSGVEFLETHGLRSVCVPLVSSTPAEALLEQVQSRKAGLLVVGAYGKSVLTEFFFGSTTDILIAQSPVPVFLYS